MFCILGRKTLATGGIQIIVYPMGSKVRSKYLLQEGCVLTVEWAVCFAQQFRLERLQSCTNRFLPVLLSKEGRRVLREGG